MAVVMVWPGGDWHADAAYTPAPPLDSPEARAAAAVAAAAVGGGCGAIRFPGVDDFNGMDDDCDDVMRPCRSDRECSRGLFLAVV